MLVYYANSLLHASMTLRQSFIALLYYRSYTTSLTDPSTLMPDLWPVFNSSEHQHTQEPHVGRTSRSVLYLLHGSMTQVCVWERGDCLDKTVRATIQIERRNEAGVDW